MFSALGISKLSAMNSPSIDSKICEVTVLGVSITAMVTIYLRFTYKIQHTVECYSYKQNTWASLEFPDILKSWYGLV